MSILKLKISSARPTNQLVASFETAGGNHAIAQRIVNFLESLQTGTELALGTGLPPAIAISIQENEVQAHGTLTLTTVIATNTFTINGVTFTGVASGATGNQFNIGGTDTITAANIAAAINGSVTALVAGYVTATSAINVVTVTSAFYGTSGNMTTLASGQASIVASAARLIAGAADPTAQTLNF